MVEYYISGVIIKGVYFKHEGVLTLPESITLAKELDSNGYAFHIDEKLGDNKFERVPLNELEKRLKEENKM